MSGKDREMLYRHARAIGEASRLCCDNTPGTLVPMSNDIYAITVQAQEIEPGQALLVNATGVAPWIGPMIDSVTVDGDVVRLHTVNGGETTRPVGAWVAVVDVL